MAEGGEDIANAAELLKEHTCDCETCLDEDSYKPPRWFCQQCKQRLCDKCRKKHSNVSLTKGHQITTIGDAVEVCPQPYDDFSDEARTPVCVQHNKPFELFCEKHEVPLCSDCKFIDHRKCKQLRNLEQIAEENTDRMQDVLEHLRSMYAGLGQIIKANEKEKHSVESQTGDIIQIIKKKIEEMDILRHEKVAEVEAVTNKEIDLIREESERTFATANANIVSESDKGAYTLNKMIHRELGFEINDELKDNNYFGKVTTEKSECSLAESLRK